MASHRDKPIIQGYRSRAPQNLIRWCALLLVAWLFCHTWFVEGLFVPLGVPSGSMAETILGPHYRFVCPDCGQTWLCDADVSSVGPTAVCPRCGHVTKIEKGTSQEAIRGDRVVLFRSAFSCRTPRRWEMVAFREPSCASRLAVKRVVGFPGESIQIRDGNVYINGKMVRKNLEEQWEMAVLVHEAPSEGLKKNTIKRRWFPDAANSKWSNTNGSFHHPEGAAEEKAGDPVDWLIYHHQRPKGHRLAPGPIVDELPYNQWHSRREDEVRPVTDLLLRFCVSEIAGDGWLVVRAVDQSNRLEAWIQPKSGVCEFHYNGQLIQRGCAPIACPAKEMEVTFSLVDYQLILALDGQTAIGRLLLPTDRPWHASACPLAIGSTGLSMNIEALRVFRDVYYVRPPGVLARWGFDRPVQLGPQEYYVLGDNSTISEDSRCWPTSPAVPANLLLGKPVVMPIP